MAEEKECFKCHEVKPLSDFYKHSEMADGHLNKCKVCNKRDVKENYRARKPKYQAYERDRFGRPDRKAAAVRYQRGSRIKNPDKWKARNKTRYAVKIGLLIRKACEVCGDPKSQAHHDDYSKPLDVRWLCFKHHREHHGQEVIEPVANKQKAA